MKKCLIVPALSAYEAMYGAIAKKENNSFAATCIAQCTGCTCACRCSCRAVDCFVDWCY